MTPHADPAPDAVRFPDSFTWGAASSAYQIEGAAAEEGKGPSVWDEYCRLPGAIWESQSGHAACDHYHRFRADVALMQSMGLHAYRFSISWPRVMPEGEGRVNEKGLAFYDALVDALLAAGVKPWVTLFHWDFPLALHHKGHWMNRDSVRWFADYTRVIVDRLSDRVAHWMTLNEPQCYIGGGPEGSRLAPGFMPTLAERLLMVHHTLMAHGQAVQVIRERAKLTPSVGWAPVGVSPIPADDRPESLSAARQYCFSIPGRHLWNNAWYSDPVCLGAYPEEGLRLYASDAPTPQPGDMQLIHQPLDFYGINIYNGIPITAGPDGKPVVAPRAVGHAKTAFHWPVEPDSLRWGPRFHFERYRIPVCVTENGLSAMDWVSMDGKVHDPQRIDFTRRYLLALRQAMNDGADIRAYFHWSIMDNFEWLEGYKQRFGLIHVDYTTQQRTLKDSAHWYASVIRSHGAALAENPFAGRH
ncbi:MAG: GH1 family beta-glucosidase [Planctomycetota bacterium]|nr:GH1 family beta-glucosidase [Planctomycetota bacterium]